MTNTTPRSLRAAFAATLTVLAASAAPAFGQLDDWSSIPVTAPTIKLEHSVAYSLEGGTLRAFSGFTRRWSTLNGVFGVPTVSLMNEHLIAQDGPFFYGYSSRSSRFTPLFTLSGAGTLLPPTSGQTWQSVVVDGNDVHMYSAYTGEWYTAHFGAAPSVQIKNMTVLIDDGTTIYGMSPLYGTPVPLGVSGATMFGEFGGVGIATAPGKVYGYSAHQNTWSTLSVSGTPTITNGFPSQPSFVMVKDAAAISFFSGQSGNFTTLPAALASTVSMHRSCALVADGNTVYGYSGMRGAYTTLALGVAPTLTVSHFFGIVTTPTAAYGYSGDLNAFSAPYAGTFPTVNLGQTAGYLAPTFGAGVAYSCLTNQWVPAPIATASVFVEANAVVLIDAIGMYGIAPRSTSWEFTPTPSFPSATYQTNTPQGPGMFVAQFGNDLYAFNSRYGHWSIITTDAPATSFKGHWGAAILTDGINAYAFGEFNNRWSTIPLTGAVNTMSAQVESAFVYNGNDLVAYTAFGQLNTSADYPEYWRGITIGGHLQLDLAGEAGAQSFVFLGVADEIPTPYGVLGVNPASLYVFALPVIGADGRYPMNLSVPNLPALIGANVEIQAGIQKPFGPYLTNPVTVRIL